MPKAGDVYFHKSFPYEDGTIGQKLLLVLNDSEDCSLCLVLKTTSQSRRYTKAVMGCNPEYGVYFIPKEWQGFSLPTYIQLRPVFEINLSNFIKNGIEGNIIYKFSLDKKCYELLIKCLMNHFKDDVSEYHWKLICK